jgi:hypothetical protein
MELKGKRKLVENNACFWLHNDQLDFENHQIILWLM